MGASAPREVTIRRWSCFPGLSRSSRMRDAEAGRRITVDRDLCMGSGMCIVYAPGTFAHDEETKAIVVDPMGDSIDIIRIAIEACPTGALSLTSDDQED